MSAGTSATIASNQNITCRIAQAFFAEWMSQVLQRPLPGAGFRRT
ncbi:hypothetical protein NX02_03260 [Sphingomonas sanxanigenens DSM 19645 = NX02]|uniref:Uncharacterized protein n=1 Tax=Sphingomonas sanxanigenens DSM 19645 = NX02 TaxID=1123269 RepID=W0A5S5_9SPHN|nr:hypothetical protein NX02_03260 [Sphingomonas sanxanigenens DSM 19645 = NX02]